MEQRSIDNCTTREQVKQLKAEIQQLDYKRKKLKQQLNTLQKNCDHDFIETAIMRKCKKCNWTESVYY